MLPYNTKIKVGEYYCIISSDNTEGNVQYVPKMYVKAKAKAKAKAKGKAKAKALAKGKGKGPAGKDKGKVQGE